MRTMTKHLADRYVVSVQGRVLAYFPRFRPAIERATYEAQAGFGPTQIMDTMARVGCPETWRVDLHGGVRPMRKRRAVRS